MIQELWDEYQANIINCVFINFTLLFVFFGFLINVMESYLPAVISQSYRFGKMQIKRDEYSFVSKFEVSKSWFKHFYVFAAVWSLLGLSLNLKVLLNASSAPDCILEFLDFFAGGRGRKVLVDSTSSLLAMVLITIQIMCRFYETHFIQIFSSQSKIFFLHYFMGHAHYFGVVVSLLANTEGFVAGSTSSSFSFLRTTKTQYICCFIFFYCWLQQRNCNMLLANLRKGDTGNKVSEKHFMPYGGYFEYVSSPHMLFEIVMYVAICGIIPACNTWWCITMWVMTNQTQIAWLTHKWYKENFKDYPKERFAIYPWIL